MRSTAWLYRRIHPSFLFAWLACGILIGITLGKQWPVFAAWLWLLAGLLLLPAIFKARRWWSVGIAVVAGLIIGWQRGSTEMIELNAYHVYIGATTVVNGTISDDPQKNARSQTEFSLGSIVIDDTELHGRVYVSVVGHKTELKRGDHVALKGKITEGFGSYQVTIRYATVASVNRGANPIRDVREHFSDGVRGIVQEPEASLGIGFVVGQRSALPPELDEQLKMVGLTHIVVASGYNLTILVRFARRLFARISRFVAMCTSMGLVVGFIAFSGLTPSMVRAGAVTLLSLLAWYYGRRFHPLLLIAFVAAGTAYVDPIYLWSDMGWYLSFLAFIGVLIVAPLITARIFKDKQPNAIAQLIIETVSATMMTLPLILFTFERLPVLSLVANMLVVPLIPFAMLATTIAGVVGMIAPMILGVFGIPASVIIGYIVAVVEFLSSIEWASLEIAIPVSAMIVGYGVSGTLLIIWWRKTNHKFLSRSIVE